MREFRIKKWLSGLHTKDDERSIPEDAASDSLNWLTLDDRIELSGGYSVVGTENGAGKITGLGILENVEGTPMPIRTRGKKVEYYDADTEDWVETDTADILGADADGEDTWIAFHTSLAGYQAWISSPQSGLIKMMLANPASAEDNYDDSVNFRGAITASDGRLLLWNRDRARNYLYGSHKDPQNSTVYTSVAAEVLGALGSVTYSGTLAFKSGKRTCFGVVINDGTQTVSDDKNGAFIGDGTGTIDYTTGDYSVTFDATTDGQVEADYQYEDSTSAGLADFTFTSPTRLALEGFFLPQPTGGDLLNVLTYRTEKYCLHELNAWLFSLPVSDLTPTNQEFRANMGAASFRGSVATGEGIYFVDTSSPKEPMFKLMAFSEANDQVEPNEIAFHVDLSGFEFPDAACFKWGDYICFSGRVDGETVNNRLFAYHRAYGSIDILDYQVSVADTKGGDLWAGEPSTDNVVQLFTGFSANGSVTTNFWEGKLSKLAVEELKKHKRLTVRGKIASDQRARVSLAYDLGNFAELGLIEGTGSYVNSSPSGAVGAQMVGSAAVGGDSGVTDANPYVREFRTRSGKFDEVKFRIEALDVGYLSVQELEYFDIRLYGQKNLKRYRQTS